MAEGELAGRTALVTGGGTGLGYAIAAHLLADGATVTIASRRAEVLDEAAGRLRQDAPPGADVRWVVCDVTSDDAVAAAVGAARDDAGRLDIAVANAGTGFGTFILWTDADAWNKVMALNVTGSFLVIKHAAVAMRDSGGGAICATSSIAAVLPHAAMAPYCASKAALEMLVRCAADELGMFGIRVNAVRPGIVPSEATEGTIVAHPDVRADYLAQMPISRIGTPDDVAEAVRYLVGPASSWVTGQVVTVDGGHSLRRGPDITPLLRAHLGDDAVAPVHTPRG